MIEILVYSRDRESCRMITSALGSSAVLVDSQADAKKYISGREIKVLLIDLENSEKEGIALAHYLRGIHRHYLTPIVFFAENDQYERQAFHEIHCHEYLYKPVQPDKIREIVNLLCEKLDPYYIPKGLVIRMRGGTYRFEISDIIYIEILNKNLVVHTLYDVWEFPYRPIRDCVVQGRGELVQCHRSMAVNRHFVERIDYLNRQIRLIKRPERVPLGPKYIKGLRALFDAE